MSGQVLVTKVSLSAYFKSSLSVVAAQSNLLEGKHFPLSPFSLHFVCLKQRNSCGPASN